MNKKKAAQPRDLPKPGKQYPGVHGKIVDWAEHMFEEGMMYVRVRFTDKTELCWTLQTAHIIMEADLSDWKTGDFKQLALRFRSGSSGRFTECCCVGDAAQTKHPANSATPRTGLAAPDLETLRSFLLHRNA